MDVFDCFFLYFSDATVIKIAAPVSHNLRKFFNYFAIWSVV
jgi:hypothetical protein